MWQNTDCALLELSVVHLLVQYTPGIHQYINSTALLAVLISITRNTMSAVFTLIWKMHGQFQLHSTQFLFLLNLVKGLLLH